PPRDLPSFPTRRSSDLRAGALVLVPGLGRGRQAHHDARRSFAERQAASGAAGVDRPPGAAVRLLPGRADDGRRRAAEEEPQSERSEEHTSELQSPYDLV